MIITKMALPRRTFLRGLGATLALPLLDAMVPALSALSEDGGQAGQSSGLHLRAERCGDGQVDADREPAAASSCRRPSRPLEPFRNQVLVASGLAHLQANSFDDGAGDHSRGTAAWLSGIHAKRTEGADVQLGITVDQIAARELGQDTPLPSLELALETIDLVGNCDNGYSCAYMNTLSWRTATTPLPAETNPRKVFRRLFGQGDSPEVRLAELKHDKSILDSVLQDVSRLQRSARADRQQPPREYLDAIRDIERRIQKAEERNAESELPILEAPIGIPDTFEEHIQMMFDLQVLAFQADMTRVVTFLIGRELSNRTYPAHRDHRGAPLRLASPEQRGADREAREDQHLSHRRSSPASSRSCAATPDGDGNLLDHSMIVYGSGLSDGNRHDHSPLPILVRAAARQHEGRRARRVAEGHADDQPAPDGARYRRRPDRHAWRQHRHAQSAPGIEPFVVRGSRFYCGRTSNPSAVLFPPISTSGIQSAVLSEFHLRYSVRRDLPPISISGISLAFSPISISGIRCAVLSPPISTPVFRPQLFSFALASLPFGCQYLFHLDTNISSICNPNG